MLFEGDTFTLLFQA